MPPNSRMIPVAAVALLTVLTGCGEGDAGSGSEILARYQVSRGDLVISITEGGSLRSAEATEVVARTKGWITFIIPDGSRVEKGELLMELENSDRVDKLERARLDREEALRNLAKAEADLQLHQLEADKTLADADRALRFAKLELQQYEQGTAQLRENELTLKVERAEVELEQEKERLALMPALLEEGFVTKAELESSQLRVKELKQDLETHRQNLEVFQRFERPKEIERLRADVSSAQLQLKREEQRMAAQRSQKEAEVKKHQYTAERKKGEVSELETHVENLVIRAPNKGVVVHGNPNRRHWQPQESFEIGDQINWNQTVMSLPDLTDMICETGINEVYIDKVAVGMRAETRIESLDTTFQGEIRKIAATASERYDVKEYKTEITLEGTDGRAFRPGMSTKVTVFIDRLEDVLSVPLDAVYERDGETYVYVEGAGGPTRQTVELGQANDHFVVVEQGLEAGDEILVLAIEPGEA